MDFRPQPPTAQKPQAPFLVPGQPVNRLSLNVNTLESVYSRSPYKSATGIGAPVCNNIIDEYAKGFIPSKQIMQTDYTFKTSRFATGLGIGPAPTKYSDVVKGGGGGGVTAKFGTAGVNANISISSGGVGFSAAAAGGQVSFGASF